MAFSTYSSFSTKKTPQTVRSPFEDEVKNNAGGYVYSLTPLKRLERFLILGSSGGTYYVTEQKLTKEAAEGAIAALKSDGLAAVRLIVEISQSGRAAKNDPAIFALALACSIKSSSAVRAAALAALPAVCRIPTHLFHFLTYVEQFRGWGRSLKRAVANWYLEGSVESLAFHATKYQQRDGWSNRDALRLSHPKTSDPERNFVFKWITSGLAEAEKAYPQVKIPKPIFAFETAKATKPDGLVALIKEFRMTREQLPTEALATPSAWQAMLPSMPLGAMLRNLGNMTRIGVIKPLSEESAFVAAALMDEAGLKRARLHPYEILVALKVYQSGGGYLSDKTWTPVQSVVDALNRAFYLSFSFLEPTGKSYLLGVDVSGSMSSSMIGGRVDGRGLRVPGVISAAEGAAAMALAIAKTERNYHVMGFTAGVGGRYNPHHYNRSSMDGFINLGITPEMDLNTALARTRGMNFGVTDCALPMLWATQNKAKVDAFIVLTDNETWAGGVKPKQALDEYRQKMGINAKQIVVGMTATNFTIADPSDENALDVVGFDASVPKLIADFVGGRF